MPKRISCLFLGYFDPPKQKHRGHILCLIFLAGVLKFLKLIVGKEQLCLSLSWIVSLMIAIFVNLSIPNIARRSEIMVLHNFQKIFLRLSSFFSCNVSISCFWATSKSYYTIVCKDLIALTFQVVFCFKSECQIKTFRAQISWRLGMSLNAWVNPSRMGSCLGPLNTVAL